MALTSRRVRQYEMDPEALERQLDDAFSGISVEELNESLNASICDVKIGEIVIAKVDTVDERTGLVIMDVGGKAEGTIPLAEFGDELPAQGAEFEVFYEGLDEYDMSLLSKRRADRLRAWERVSTEYNEGDEIQGIVQRKIKGGLLVDVEGVNVFLPASQVNLRRTHDISDFLGEPVRARIIKIDPERMNIVVSRRKLLEEERQRLKEDLLKDITEGQVRMGTVKNIADFGVFVDLGGIDGLLHITDMSWGRISHPSEMVEMDQEIEVKVLRVDFERERIALGIKQKTSSPWDGVEERYPVNKRMEGEVVNIMSYGAFVKLEDGIEGLVHISEMSWTRRVNHPSEMLNTGDKVSVIVLEYNHEKQEISLGMKQAESNPWDLVESHYPVGTVISGTVRNLTPYGAFVEIEEGIDGLLHVSDMSWTKKVSHPSEMVKKGDEMQCVILSVDKEKKRIALGRKQLSADPWHEQIPGSYHVGDLLSGYVTKVTNFGVFVKLEEGLEGLLHISELTDDRGAKAEDLLFPGQKVEVRVIRVDVEDRKIGLSFVHADFGENDEIIAAAKAAQAANAESGDSSDEDSADDSAAPAEEAAAPAEEAAAPAEEAAAPAEEAAAPAEEAAAPAEEAEAPAEEAEAPAEEAEAPAEEAEAPAEEAEAP
ncbi:MAG TPA: 30S ribosomal protein S1, partial [Planctomycetota bacterium]|nr:30S ribosomal protein S1 [Planctomycetota bacterium]